MSFYSKFYGQNGAIIRICIKNEYKMTPNISKVLSKNQPCAPPLKCGTSRCGTPIRFSLGNKKRAQRM